LVTFGTQAGAAEELAVLPPELPPALATVLPPELPPAPPEFPAGVLVLAAVAPPAWLPPAGGGFPLFPPFSPPAGVSAHPPANNNTKSVHRGSLGMEHLLRIAGFARPDRIYEG